MRVSIVIPALNEEEGIGKTIDMIKRDHFERRGWDLEILVIDGNSTDKTREVAKEKGAKVIVEPRKGYGRAYKTGLKEAKGDIIVTGDADATYPFDKIQDYIDYLLNRDLDFITTNRFANLEKGAMSVKHRFGNLILSLTLCILFQIWLKDSQSGMWIFRREALDEIQSLEDFDDGMPFSEEIKIEMFKSKRIKAEEIPSTLYTREGKAKLQSFRDGWKNLKFLFKKRLRWIH